jgi:hypothetical protein
MQLANSPTSDKLTVATVAGRRASVARRPGESVVVIDFNTVAGHIPFVGSNAYRGPAAHRVASRVLGLYPPASH